MPTRTKTKYPGVYYREARRIGGAGTERIFYITFKKDNKTVEEKVGRQYADDMTPARAAGIRGERVEGKRMSRREVREQEEARRKAEAGKWTVDRLWNEYKGQRPEGKGLKTDTGRYDKYLKPGFGNVEPANLIQLDVDRLRVNLGKKKSPQTVKHVLALLARILNFGVNRGLCQGPGFKITMPKVNNQKTEDLTPEQLKKLLEAIDKDTHPVAGPMMKMALYTGMRRGELFKLQWDDVDFDRGFIHIRQPKGGKDQTIPLNGPAHELLKSLPRSSSFVFPGRKGGKRQFIRRYVNAIRDRAGLPDDFRPLHGLRHVYASMLASSGQVDLYTLQKLLTHKSPVMTQRYAHLRDESLRKASDLAGEIVTGAMQEHEPTVLKIVKPMK